MSDDQSRNPGLPACDGSIDPWLWLEGATGDDVLEWVREHNARTEQEPDTDGEATTLAVELKTILDPPASIPNVVCRGDRLHNSWADVRYPRGSQRRTLMDSCHTEEPD